MRIAERRPMALGAPARPESESPSGAHDGQPPAGSDDWVERSFAVTRACLEAGWRAHLPWRRGLWVTARESYRPARLPEGFAIAEIDVPRGRRRIATREGRGRPLLILPGLCGALDEDLTCRLASAASRAGRPVVVLEDQLASSTLRISHGYVGSFLEQGQQVRLLARRFTSLPDVLALSMGSMVALTAPAGTLHRLAAWSAVVDESTVQRVRSSRILSWHYARECERSFRRAGLPPPNLDDLFRVLFRAGPAPAPPCPALFIHAADDPIAPARAVERRMPGTLIVNWGGHLGFGAVAGASVYLSPFGLA